MFLSITTLKFSLVPEYLLIKANEKTTPSEVKKLLLRTPL